MLIRTIILMVALLGLGGAVMAQGPVFEVPLNIAHVGVQNSEFTQGMCPTPPAGKENWYGWHFIMPGNNNFTSLTVTFKEAGKITANPFPGVFVADPDNSHAYIWTKTDDILLGGVATSDGTNNFFNLSHVCTPVAYEALKVTKTAETSYTRQHKWDIFKKVETEDGFYHDGYPKIWLYTDGGGDETATWTVDVIYEGYEDSKFNISGEITIENTGTLDAKIISVEDILAGAPISVDCGVTFPYTLPVGETLVCTYSEAVDSKIGGFNVVTVTTEEDEYDAEAEITWGEPTEEINKTVTIEDDSDLFGVVELGKVTAPLNDPVTFKYTKDFAWEDYGAAHCGDYVYDNTATIVETEQSASATLKVNVQCYVYETAYAMGDAAICFIPDFSQWGWTNPVEPGTYTMNLWAGAGQCDTSKGTLVGEVSVQVDVDSVSGQFLVTVGYNVDKGVILEETHFYAGPTKFPMVQSVRKKVATVAPGQYYNRPFMPSSDGNGFVIAHAVVGLPDPNFGPE